MPMPIRTAPQLTQNSASLSSSAIRIVLPAISATAPIVPVRR
jgi:hypothetical protein